MMDTGRIRARLVLVNHVSRRMSRMMSHVRAFESGSQLVVDLAPRVPVRIDASAYPPADAHRATADLRNGAAVPVLRSVS